MSTGQSDDEMDDADEMDYDDAPTIQDPSSSSTSIPKAKPKAKPLSKNSKEKAAREAEMAKARKAEAIPVPYVETPYVETLRPKPLKQQKYDKIGINELTDKKAELDYDNRRSHWSRQRVGYLKDQLLLRGYRITHESRVSHADLLDLLRHDYHI